MNMARALRRSAAGFTLARRSAIGFTVPRRSAFGFTVPRRSAFGFTLIELVTSLVIISVLAAVAAPILSRGLESYFQGTEVAYEDADARLAMERMLRDFRQIRNPAGISKIICAGTCTSTTFTDNAGNTVLYVVNGGNLVRQAGNAGVQRILSSNVTSFTLTFLQADGQTTVTSAANASLVCFIAVQMTVASGTGLPAVNLSYTGAARLSNS